MDSLEYCIREKGLILFGYVIMSNHLHLIISKRPLTESFSSIIRDFKKFTAMQLIKSIANKPEEIRREWLLWIMGKAIQRNGNNTKYQF